MKPLKSLMLVAIALTCLANAASADIRGIPDAWILDDLLGVENPYAQHPNLFGGCYEYSHEVPDHGYQDYNTMNCIWYDPYHCTLVPSWDEGEDCCGEDEWVDLY